MIELNFEAAKQIDGINDLLSDIRHKMEQKLNLNEYSDNVRPVTIPKITIQRICLLVGLSDNSPRNMDEVSKIVISKAPYTYNASFFTKDNLKKVFSALIKLRYNGLDVSWDSPSQLSKIIGFEIMRGREILMNDDAMDEWLSFNYSRTGVTGIDIPVLNLHIGLYDNGMDAFINMNNRSISNTQMLIAGATGSGKTNLIAVLLQQIRMASTDSSYPVNFLLFDYKGEFSDPANEGWLDILETESGAILDPMECPLPFTPFKDFTDGSENDVVIYASAMSQALISIAVGDARISANMDERLCSAIENAYYDTKGKPITFEQILDNYRQLLPDGKKDKSDSVTSILSQLCKVTLFDEEDKIDLLKDCYIINLGRCPKDGIYAKAVVYFVISKIYDICEQLSPQASNKERYEIRHFTIVDEAHYMLKFDNQPLQNLIKVGRSKGMSVILATQNMSDFKTRKFDFFANVQYSMGMLQQSQNDAVLKDLFGVSGNALQELKNTISTLQKGEVIIKDTNQDLLGLGGDNNYKKIKVTHLI